ncbi:MAG: cytidine deaminase [Peptostreptococcus porci]|nr:cytidine deaminase [Peptostreptococcus porci]
MEDYSGKADIWEELYKRAKEIYSPEQISPFINVKKITLEDLIPNWWGLERYDI